MYLFAIKLREIFTVEEGEQLDWPNWRAVAKIIILHAMEYYKSL